MELGVETTAQLPICRQHHTGLHSIIKTWKDESEETGHHRHVQPLYTAVSEILWTTCRKRWTTPLLSWRACADLLKEMRQPLCSFASGLLGFRAPSGRPGKQT